VFIGLTEVAGYYGSLASGFAELGIKTKLVDLDGHRFEYGAEAGGRDWLVDLYRCSSRRRAQIRAGRVLPTLWWRCLQKVSLLAILTMAMVTCDAFVLSCGSTFLRYLELPVLKLFGKRLIFVCTGSDHRPPYLSGISLSTLDDQAIARCGELVSQTKRMLGKIERYADVLVGHHLSAHLHEKPFVPILLVGIPFATRTEVPIASDAVRSGGVRIVHAPSRPKQKGSAEIRKAVEALRARGFAIDFVELIDVTNQVVLDELSRCDFIVDELYSDTRMARLATEAAFFGKPAVVGGYASDEDLAIPGVYPTSQFPPVQFCHPDDLEDAIHRLIVDVPYRLELGKRAQDYVRSVWTPREVALRFVALIRDEIPDAWMFDPLGIRYVFGVGMPEAVARAGVQRFIEMLGLPALCLSDKPETERALQAFAGGEPALRLQDAERLRAWASTP
jgi:hypothetical protein